MEIRVLRSGSLLLALAWLLLFSGMALAQNPVSLSVEVEAHKVIHVGDKFLAQVNAKIASGWHIYSLTQPAGGPNPTRIVLPDGQPFKLAGKIKGPAPHVQLDPNFGINSETHEGTVSFSVPVATSSAAATGMQPLEIDVRFQACTDTTCLPPRTVKLNATVTLAALSAITPSSSPEPTPTGQGAKVPSSPTPAVAPLIDANDNKAQQSATPMTTLSTGTPVAAASAATPRQAKATDGNTTTIGSTAVPFGTNTSGLAGKGSIWSFIWLAMSVGALSLLTPCVFPMVPITVSYFTNHAAGRRAGAVRDALIYALGIVLTFTALGVALAVLFGAAGINKFAASPWINIAITAIFLSFALSLLGAYNLQMPSSVLTKLDSLSRSRESGKIVGLLLMGLTFSLTSFTCTAPFVGTLLVMASQGKWFYPVVGMLAFSTVFAVPFFVLALAPQLVSQLPKSGGWLNSVKVVMGLLEIAAAMKFLSNVDLVWHWGIFTREVVLASWLAVTLLIAIYLLGKFQLSHDSAVGRIGAARLLIALVSLAFSFYLLTGLLGRRLGELESFLPPATENSSSAVSPTSGTNGQFTANGELTWITNDYEVAMKRAKAEMKPVLIDFTGYTCTNCRWMEVNMFTKVLVRAELEKYVRVRLYTDGEGQPYEGFQQMQQDRFGTVALPLYVVLDGEGRSLLSFPGLTRNETEFVSFLKTGETKFAPGVASLNRVVSQR